MTTAPQISTSREAWKAARKALRKKEKALTQIRELVAIERGRLPWLRVEKEYAFDTVTGRKSLAELFGGCSQLIVHHLMYHPDWEAACPGWPRPRYEYDALTASCCHSEETRP